MEPAFSAQAGRCDGSLAFFSMAKRRYLP